MTEHEALVDRVAQVMIDLECATGIPMQIEPGEFGTVLGREPDWHAIVRATLDAILDGNTLIVGTRIGDGLVRGERKPLDAFGWWNLAPITDTDPAHD